MDVDAKDPMWNRYEIRTQRQPGTITFLPHSQPVLKHFGCRRAATYDEKLASAGQVFGTGVDAVQPTSRFKVKVIRQARLTNDSGRIDHMTAMQLMSPTVASAIT